MRHEDVVDLLLAQHARIEELFAATLESTGAQREQCFYDLVRLLAVHETAEEEIVHPYARVTIEAGDEIVEDRLTEEREAKEMLADLYERGVDAPDFEERLITLRDAVLMHAAAEERYELKYLRASVDADRLRTMAEAVRDAEALAPTRPHPGVEAATPNVAVGPVLAIADRARDLVRDRMRNGR
jgi:hypothetical protein